LKKLQQAKILGPDGSVVGTIFDENGNLNPLASVSNYSKAWSDAAKDLIKGKENVTPAWMLFKPTQIKEAMGNLTFSPYSNDIRFNKGGAI
jgi:hypothetical protein